MAQMGGAEEMFWQMQSDLTRQRMEIADLGLLLAALAVRGGGPLLLPAAELRAIRGRILRIAADTSGDVIVWAEDPPEEGAETSDGQLR